MASPSAGLLLYRFQPSGPAGTTSGPAGTTVQVLLAHPGGPFWRRKDAGAWSIPKGEFADDEDPLTAARREFTEELGTAPPPGPYLDLGSVRQSGGKTVTAWAVAGDLDPASASSNLVDVEWPPRSGRRIQVPEVDRVEWFDVAQARQRILAGQLPLLDRLMAAVQTVGAGNPGEGD